VKTKFKTKVFENFIQDDNLKKLDGKVVEVTVDDLNHRTMNQNAYYWGVVLALISERTGYEREELHEMYKFKFNKRMKEFVNNQTGEIETDEYGATTVNLGVDEFAKYIEQIQRWAAKFLQLNIPDPVK